MQSVLSWITAYKVTTYYSSIAMVNMSFREIPRSDRIKNYQSIRRRVMNHKRFHWSCPFEILCPLVRATAVERHKEPMERFVNGKAAIFFCTKELIRLCGRSHPNCYELPPSLWFFEYHRAILSSVPSFPVRNR